MADQQKAESDPSIEEILDSIRQIIAEEDDEPKPAATEPPKSFQQHLDDDIIELTDKIEDLPQEEPLQDDVIDLSNIAAALTQEEPVAPLTPPPAPVPQPVVTAPAPPEPLVIPPTVPEPRTTLPEDISMNEPDDSSLTEILSKRAEDSIAGALSELTRRSEIQRGGGITIEDVVREELKPLLRHWLDKHLPTLVERLLQKELERISRRVQGD